MVVIQFVLIQRSDLLKVVVGREVFIESVHSLISEAHYNRPSLRLSFKVNIDYKEALYFQLEYQLYSII